MLPLPWNIMLTCACHINDAITLQAGHTDVDHIGVHADYTMLAGLCSDAGAARTAFYPRQLSGIYERRL